MSRNTCAGKSVPKGDRPYAWCVDCGRDLAEPEQKQRSQQQNKSLHKWAEELADEFNNRGLDMKTVLKPEVDIPWDKNTVKRFIVHPIIKAMYNKDSTADLTTTELSRAVDTINRFFADKWNFTLPFPSMEDMDAEQRW